MTVFVSKTQSLDDAGKGFTAHLFLVCFISEYVLLCSFSVFYILKLFSSFVTETFFILQVLILSF